MPTSSPGPVANGPLVNAASSRPSHLALHVLEGEHVASLSRIGGPGSAALDDREPQDPGAPAPADGLNTPVGVVMHGALALLATQPITWAASLLATAMTPRYLTDHELGQYAVALTVAGLAGTLVALGIPTSLVRSIASRPREIACEGAAALAIVGGLSAGAAVSVALVWSWLALPGSESGVLPYALLGMVIANVLQIVFSIFVGLEQHARFAWINAAAAALSQFASVAALMAGGSLVDFVATGVLVQAGIVLVAWKLIPLHLAWMSITHERVQRIVIEGAPFLGSVLTHRIRGDIEIALIAFFLAEQAVGWWAAASRIVSAPMFIPFLIATPLLPALSQHVQERAVFQSTLRRSLILVVLVTVPFGAMIGALAPVIPERLGWAASFAGAIPLMVVLSASMPLIAIGVVLGTGMIALGQERRLLGLNIAATIVSAGSLPALLVLSAPWTGDAAVGAGLARLLTECVMVFGAAWSLPRGTFDWTTVTALIRIVLAGGALAAVTTALLPMSPELAGVVGGLLFVACTLLLRVVLVSELLDLWRLARRRVGLQG